MLNKYPHTKNILILTRQAGSVLAFYPLIKYFKNRSWKYFILASDISAKVWNEYGYIPSGHANLDNSFKPMDNIDLLLSGTSLEVFQDAKFWKWAKRKRIPSIGFVDSWVNYSQRFTIKNYYDTTPEIIGVIDRFMYNKMILSGAPENKLRIVGHPRFDMLSNLLTKNIHAKKSVQKNVVVFTDPGVINGKDSKIEIGYSPIDVIAYLLNQFANTLEQKKEHDFSIIIKPHPRESIQTYEEIVNKYSANGWAKVSNEKPKVLLSQADVIIGMNSILLIDSSVIGLPTYSLQPNRKIAHNDITDNRDGINVITDNREINKLVISILDGSIEQKVIKKPIRNNVKLFCNLINEVFETSNK